MELTTFTHAIILDGTKAMNLIPDAAVTVQNGTIISIEKGGVAPRGAREIDLRGKYLIPGLINLHCHLAGDGKPQKIDGSTAKLIEQQLRNPIGRFVMKRMTAISAKTALLAGITTIRTVGGLSSFDAEVRDEIAAGKRIGPRILAANEAISVPGGHMAGTLALIAHSPLEAKRMVGQISEEKPDLIKLMITGGTLDIERPGDEGKVLMTDEEISVAVKEAHRLGYPVSAHVQSTDGIRAALLNGVDTIEHGASLDDAIVALFKEKGAALISTITPVAIMACLPTKSSGLPELYQKSCELYMKEVITGFRRAVREDIPIGLGLDDGSPYVTHYGMWRELDFFARYIGVSPEYALWCATGRNAEIAGIAHITGTVEIGKSADFLVADENPLKDFSCLSKPYMVVKGDQQYRKPKCRRFSEIDRLVDKVKEYDARFVAGERIA